MDRRPRRTTGRQADAAAPELVELEPSPLHDALMALAGSSFDRTPDETATAFAAVLVDEAAYAIFLADRITAALAAQGVPAPEMLAPHISPPNSRRRAALSAQRRGRQVL